MKSKEIDSVKDLKDVFSKSLEDLIIMDLP
jgi:hypothetical protein